jgi:hypothetical protein
VRALGWRLKSNCCAYSRLEAQIKLLCVLKAGGAVKSAVCCQENPRLQKPSSAKAEKRGLMKEAALVKEALRW